MSGNAPHSFNSAMQATPVMISGIGKFYLCGIKNSFLETDIRRFFLLLVKAICAGLLWMSVNTIIGFKLKLVFVEQRFTIGHAIFYAWAAISFFFVLKYILKQVKQMPRITPHEP